MSERTLVFIRIQIFLAVCTPHHFLVPTLSFDHGHKVSTASGREGILSLLNTAVETINLAKEASSTTPA